jgi:DNA repair ATPase RecN
MTTFPDPPGDPGAARATATRDRDRTLEAMHALEAATGRPASADTTAWMHVVADALEHLESALAEQRAGYDDPIGLMAELAQDDPRLRTWVRQLQHRWSDLGATAHALRETLESSPDPQAVHDVRERVRWLMGAIRHHREREADLLFAALGIEHDA